MQSALHIYGLAPADDFLVKVQVYLKNDKKVTEQYGTSRLEACGWHVIMDGDRAIDFKIGNGEVYNLHVWTNNGGGWNYFISFRPMALPFKDKTKNYAVNLSGREIPIVNLAPELESKDLSVKVNGQDMEFISLQKFYETQGPDHGMPDYLVQVLRKGPATFGKQTVVVEYDNEVEMDGKKTRICSQGTYQFYLNYNGLSEYF